MSAQEAGGRWVSMLAAIDGGMQMRLGKTGMEFFIPAPDARDAEIAELRAKLEDMRERKQGHKRLEYEYMDKLAHAKSEIATLKSQLADMPHLSSVGGWPVSEIHAYITEASKRDCQPGELVGRLESQISTLKSQLAEATKPVSVDTAATLARIARRAEMLVAAWESRQIPPTTGDGQWKTAYECALIGEPAHLDAERKVREGMVRK